jgi:hypothetical protein
VKPIKSAVLKAIALVAGFASHALAQTPRPVLGSGSCTSCSVTVARFVEIGGTDGEGALPIAQPWVMRDQRGRIYAYGSGIEGVMAYDSAGRFLRRIGRAGSGPGEFRGVSGAVGIAGDSVAIIDGTLRRMTVLDPELATSRTVSISGSFSGGVRIGTEILAVNAPDARRGPSVAAIAVSTGKTVLSFGASELKVPEGTLRSLAADTTGVWVAFATQYRIERWLKDGSFAFALERQAGWFDAPSDAERRRRLQTGEPSPLLQSIDVDERGRLWVLTTVSDPRWATAVRLEPGKRFPDVVDPVKHQNSVLEIIDPTLQAVLVSKTYDSPQLSLLPGQWLVESTEDTSGRPILRISKLQLKGP